VPGKAGRAARSGSRRQVSASRAPQRFEAHHLQARRRTVARTRRNLGLMMREGLLKENIDGEALMWAHQRLMARLEQRRILMVISDGAPVRRFDAVCERGDVSRTPFASCDRRYRGEVCDRARGDRHRPRRDEYYRRAVTIVDAEQLGGAMTSQLISLFGEEEFHGRWTGRSRHRPRAA